MGNPPPYWQPPAPRNNTDFVVSVIVLVGTVVIAGAGAVLGVFSLAFLDYCPPESCSVDGAVTVVMTTIGVAAAVVLAGLIVTVVRLRKRRNSWPFAVGTLALVVAVLFFGALAYTRAVSY